MAPFSSFFLILLVAVIFSGLFRRMRIPWVVALIVGGMVIGPGGLDWFDATDPTIDFFASVGLVFVMFMAGLESQFSRIDKMGFQLATTALLIATIPAFAGVAIALLFGYSITSAVLVGIIFMSSAVALLIPQFHKHKLIKSPLGKLILGAAISIDAFSLLALSIYLDYVSASLSVYTIITYLALIAGVALVGYLVPKIRWLSFSTEYAEEQDLFEKELRFIILILIGFVVLFEFVGLHAIIAAFFAGLVLASSITSRLIKAKLHAISYGFFVPVFFVVMGASVDMSVFLDGVQALALTSAIVLGLLLSKFCAGFLAGRINGYTLLESSYLGITVTPQLSTALAVAFLGLGEGIIDDALVAAIVVLAVVTATIAPIITEYLSSKLVGQHTNFPETN
jgi:Kef-type K+ transport system membrane component KefB